MFWYIPAVFFSSLFLISCIGAVTFGAWAVYRLKRYLKFSFFGTAILLFFLLQLFFYIIMRILIALSTIAFIIIIVLIIAAMMHMASPDMKPKQ